MRAPPCFGGREDLLPGQGGKRSVQGRGAGRRGGGSVLRKEGGFATGAAAGTFCGREQARFSAERRRVLRQGAGTLCGRERARFSAERRRALQQGTGTLFG